MNLEKKGKIFPPTEASFKHPRLSPKCLSLCFHIEEEDEPPSVQAGPSVGQGGHARCTEGQRAFWCWCPRGGHLGSARIGQTASSLSFPVSSGLDGR